jgi:lipid A 3-O-deacylase
MTASRTWVLVTSLILAAAFAPAAGAAGIGGLAVYGGIFNTANDDNPLELGLEYRFDGIKIPKLPASLALRPAVGIAGTEDGNKWIYGGLRLDVKLLGWAVTPQFAVTLYDHDDGRDLGGVLEFRSGLEVSFRFAKGPRLGLLFYHMSNGDFYERNPGSNSLVVTLSLGR